MSLQSLISSIFPVPLLPFLSSYTGIFLLSKENALLIEGYKSSWIQGDKMIEELGAMEDSS